MATTPVRTILVATLVGTIFACVPANALDVVQVLEHARRATAPGKDMRATCDLEIVNAQGESVHWAGSYYRRSEPDRRARLVLDSPVDLRGTEVVVTPDDGRGSSTSIYLPSVRRARTIRGDTRGESFLGTDFNYEDLGFQNLEFQQHSLADGVDKEGRDCLRVESVPQAGWWYGRLVNCIDRKTFLPLRTEYYDRTGELWKIRTLEGIKTIQGYPTPTVITMQTVPARTLTRITLSDIRYDTGLADVLFEPRD
jgi:hypothetical protein